MFYFVIVVVLIVALFAQYLTKKLTINIIFQDLKFEMQPFNIPPFIGKETEYIQEAINNRKLCGDGVFTKKCSQLLSKITSAKHVLLTTSCSHALDMSAILIGVGPGDEVIMPSYTFVSTSNAFVLRGATPVFVDIRPDTMNIDERLIEKAITSKTKAIVPVHYAGVGCEMDTIVEIAKKYNLFIIEDAAQGVASFYKGKSLGTIGDFGCLSFHETKNITMGEGGALIINDDKMFERAEIIREKGTDRAKFIRGQVDKYTWTDVGSSYLPSEINAAYLLAQLENIELIQQDRLKSWGQYFDGLKELRDKGYIEFGNIPQECTNNAHMFYIKCRDIQERTSLIAYLKNKGICSAFHYVPLHSSPAGIKYGRFFEEDLFTTSESARLLRLPMYYGLKEQEIEMIISVIKKFYIG